MDNHRFSSFNFPCGSPGDLRPPFSSYGNTGPILVYQDESTLMCVPQKKGNTKGKRVRLIASKPTLPLKTPNKVCRQFSFLNDDHKQLWNCDRNLMNFCTDHADILHEGLIEIVREQVRKLLWKQPYFHTRRAKRYNSFLGNFFDDLSDTPLEMLGDLFQESWVQDQVESTGKYFGNCLAHQIDTLSGNHDIVLAHPCGELMDKLSLNFVQFHSEDDGVLSTTLLPTENHTFNFPNTIRQIHTVNQSQSSSSVMAIRTDYSCSFIKQKYGDDDDRPTTSVVGNLACKTKPCSVAVNPFIPGEAIIAMETGSLCLWSEKDASLQMVKECSACVAEDFDWYICDFGSHPRQVIYYNKRNVELLDLRDNLSGGKDLMSVPSPYMFKDDQFTAVQRHPQNPYHYFLGTNESLMIVDERFPQNPVLNWKHSLGESIKHLQVVTNTFPGCSDILLVCGGYKSHNVHCYQYCQDDNSMYSFGMTIDGGLPPQSTSSPWKVSSYSEWPQMVDFPNKAEILPAVVRQLDQPLLGLTCIPSPSSKTLTILQMSKTGDLFYQCFTPREKMLTEEVDQDQVYYFEDMDIDFSFGSCCSSAKAVLTEKDQHVVESWLECVTHEQVETNLADLQESSDTFNFSDAALVHEKVFSKLENSSKCALCDDGTASSSVNTIGEFSKKCDCCGLDKSVSDTLSSTRTTAMTILTNAFLRDLYEPEKLDLFDENVTNVHPLDVALLKNWHSEEQMPVNLGVEPQDATTMEEENVSKTQDRNEKEIPEPTVDGNKTNIKNTELNASQNCFSPSLHRESSQIPETRRLIGTSTEKNDDSMLGIANNFSANLGSQFTSTPVRISTTKDSTKKSSVKRKQARVAGF